MNLGVRQASSPLDDDAVLSEKRCILSGKIHFHDVAQVLCSQSTAASALMGREKAFSPLHSTRPETLPPVGRWFQPPVAETRA